MCACIYIYMSPQPLGSILSCAFLYYYKKHTKNEYAIPVIICSYDFQAYVISVVFARIESLCGLVACVFNMSCACKHNLFPTLELSTCFCALVS